MPSTLELAEQYFGTKDLYKLFDVAKTALEKEITKAYYKLALKYHPDRVDEAEKEVATEKFKVLAKLHSVLTTQDKRALYDEQGVVGDDDDDKFGSQWLETWRAFFKPITEEDILNYEKQYVGSELEKADIRKAYVNGKGCLDFMINHVPFMGVEDEPRIVEMVKEWIAAGEVPEYKMFVDEPKAKRARRHKKYAREAKEASSLKEQMATDDLQKQIMQRQAERGRSYNSLLDRLAQKYGNGDGEEEESDDSEPYEPPQKSEKKRKSLPRKAAKKANV